MSKQHIDQKHTGNDEHIDSWFVVYSFKRWLNAVVDVGQKLLAMNSNHTEQGLRSTYEHFFVISLMKSLEWGNEIQSFDKDKYAIYCAYKEKFPEAKLIRNMKEHEVEYYKGE